MITDEKARVKSLLPHTGSRHCFAVSIIVLSEKILQVVPQADHLTADSVNLN